MLSKQKISCNYLNTNEANTIAVSDTNTNLIFKKITGLVVATNNTNDNIKLIYDVIIIDNNHNDCKKVLEIIYYKNQLKQLILKHKIF